MSQESYGSGDTSRTDVARAAVGETAHTAREEAADVARSAKESGQHLAQEARHEARDVTREAGRQARGLLDRGREELTDQATQQQQRLAGQLRSFSEELGSMVEGSGASEEGLARDLARRLADGTQAAASWLDERGPGGLVDEVERFARTRPGTFLAIAAGAGLLVGRLTRGIKDVHAGESEDSPDLGPAGAYGAAGSVGTTSSAGTGTPSGATPTTWTGAGTSTSTGTPSTTYGTGSPLGSAAGASAGAGAAALGETGTSAGEPTSGVERRPVGEGLADASRRSALGGTTGSTWAGATDEPTQRHDAIGDSSETPPPPGTPGSPGARPDEGEQR